MVNKDMENELTFNDQIFPVMIKGMLMSAKIIIDFEEQEHTKGDPNAFSIGCHTSAILLSTFCAELLLKYKITEEGKRFEKTHNLHDLYNKLEPQSQSKIEDEFNKLASEINLPENYDSVKSVFFAAQDDFVNWRYIAISPTGIAKVTTSYPQVIQMAAVSVYNSIKLDRNFKREVVTEEYLREQGISEQDLRSMGMSEKHLKMIFKK